MKKFLCLFLALIIIFSITVSAADYRKLTSVRTVPKAVFDKPYVVDEWLTRYAPWMDNFHFRSQYEVEHGYHGGEANQQQRVLAISPVDSDVMYFGSDCAGLYRTADGGENWFNINAINPTRESYWILCDKFERETVYILSRKVGLCRSRDMGESWELIVEDTYTKNSRRSGSIAQDEEGNTFIGVGSGVYRLDRKTDTVQNLFALTAETDPMFKALTSLKGDSGVVCYDLDVSPDGMDIYAVIKNGTADIVKGIYISRDGGKTWTIKKEHEGKILDCSSIVLHPENKDEIYTSIQFKNAETGEIITPYAFYRTTDCFETIELRGSVHYRENDEGVHNVGVLQMKATFGPKNADGIYPLYYTGDITSWPLRVSYDYAKTFTRFVENKPEDIVVNREAPIGVNIPKNSLYAGYQSQGFAPDMNVPGRVVFCGGGAHVKEADGKVYRINAGYSGANVDCIAFNSKKVPWIGTCDIGAYVTASGTWTSESFPAMHQIAKAYNDDYVLATFDPNDDNHLITHLGASNSTPPVYGVRQSFDGGNTFEPINPDTAIPKGEIKLGNPQVLQYDKNDSNIIYSSYSNSYDNGKTWIKNEYVIAAISPVNDHKWVGMKGTLTDCELYYTEDAGKTWTFIKKVNMRKDTSFLLDGANDDYFWHAGRYGLSRINIKTGETESFNDHFKGFSHFQTIKQNPKDFNHFVVTSIQAGTPEKDWFLAETRDGGKSWSIIPRIWGSSSHMITFPEHLDYAIVGTMGGLMIYRYKEFWKYQDSAVKITINDQATDFASAAVIENNRVMVPMRDIFEALGAEVNYNGETKIITARKGDHYIHLTPGSTEAIADGKPLSLGSAPYINEKGVTMVPIRFVAEALNVNVGWDEKDRLVFIRT